MKIKVYIYGSKDKITFKNPSYSGGWVEIMVGLEDKYQGKYTAEQASRIVSGYFEGASLIGVTGLWKRKTENAVMIRILNQKAADFPKFRQTSIRLARSLRKRFKQDSVITTLYHPDGNVENLFM